MKPPTNNPRHNGSPKALGPDDELPEGYSIKRVDTNFAEDRFEIWYRGDRGTCRVIDGRSYREARTYFARHCTPPKAPQAYPMRRVTFRPYRKGAGPTFTLTLWESAGGISRDQHGRCPPIGYRLTMKQPATAGGGSTVLFEGKDFYPSPNHAEDSDATVRGLMGFLTLRPGDTDAEYFEKYSDAQTEYANQHAEYLSYEVVCRFGEG